MKIVNIYVDGGMPVYAVDGTDEIIIHSIQDGPYAQSKTGDIVLTINGGVNCEISSGDTLKINGSEVVGTLQQKTTQLRQTLSPFFVNALVSGGEVDSITGQMFAYDLTDQKRTVVVSNTLAHVYDSLSNLDMPIASNRPAFFTSGGPNNLPYVEIASGKYFQIAPPVTSSPMSIYAVLKLPALTNDARMFTIGADGNGPVIYNNKQATSNLNHPNVRLYTAVSPFYGPEVNSATRLDWMLVKVVLKDSNSLWFEVNDEVYDRKIDTAGGSALTIDNLIFSKMPGLKLSELRVFNRVLSESDDQIIKSYFVKKFNLQTPEKLMLALGDSHTAGIMAGTSVNNGSYMQRFIGTSWKCVNRGYSGSVVNSFTYNQAAGGNLYDVHVLFNKPKYNKTYVSFQYGTNDAAIHTANGTVWATWKADYKKYIQTFLSAGFSANKLIICTPPYSTGTYVAGKLGTVATMIREIASELGIMLCDFYAAMQSSGLDCNTVIGGDGIHGDNAVHQKLYETLIAITGV